MIYVPHIPMFTKVACGWSARISDITDCIIGEVHVQLGTHNTHIIPMTWDKSGLPLDIKQHPSKYYLRLK